MNPRRSLDGGNKYEALRLRAYLNDAGLKVLNAVRANALNTAYGGFKPLPKRQRRHGQLVLIDGMSCHASGFIRELSSLAQEGDDVASRRLQNILEEGINHWYCLLRRPSEDLRRRATETWKLPAFITVDRDLADENTILTTKLKLGSREGRNYLGKTARRESGPTAAVILLYEKIKRLLVHPWLFGQGHYEAARARGIPPLSRNTAPDWCEAAWPLFYEMFGRNFETHKQFQKQAKSVKTTAEKRARRGDPMTPAEQRNAIRKLIKRQIELAWRSISARGPVG